VQEKLPTVMLVEEGSKKGVPNLVLEVKAQKVLLPQQADVSTAGQTGVEMVQEEPLLMSRGRP
jgi:hypothetical protein